jgi:hypothetical protein
MNEKQLREMLRAKAATFAPTPRESELLLARARRRTARNLIRSAASVAALAAVAVVVGTNIADRVTPAESAFAAFTMNKAASKDDVAPPHAHEEAGELVTRERLETNIDCMRAQGFDLPDPIETSKGWQVIVEASDGTPLPTESRDPVVRRRWAEAVFVDCRLMNLGDELVFGGRSREQIDSLVDCARDEGFVLPSPLERRPGEFTFDLDATSPRWGSGAWYRTVFVTCGLWRFAP